MKKIFILLVLLFIYTYSKEQAREGSVSYQKHELPAAVIELPYSQDVVKDAMNDYLSKKGRSKGTDLKGFSTYRNTSPTTSTDQSNADLYFKVERKSRKEKELTVVSLLLTQPKDDDTLSQVRYLNMEEAKSYLNDLQPTIEAFNLELAIKNQNQVIIKAESKYKNLVAEGADLQKKKEKLDSKIKDNQLEQLNQASEIESQKQKLSVYVSQRK